ncbi:hypothetical protein L0P88_16005 [Muricauda sp. SCSIO 64092]|uniref:hypothetical protein n=1 Tax=Allomuricauda sp. SCSIO 64092 TaxID=2908842 RepID=UPI001FF38826|nr:hypothetical protein [Muricauda sp. SCSIO 64092]UOY05447.1 hypothetical protein L0P88_16005 [Muricauda sp. SCSIO 64092]
MENYKKNLQKVGQFISRNEGEFMIKEYRKKGGAEKNRFFIHKDCIRKTLECCENVSGIKFMFGMTDLKDSDSKSLFLFPYNQFEGKISRDSIIPKNGYLNHSGLRFSIAETMEQVACHIKYRMDNDRMGYKEVPRYVFFGKDSLNDLISTDNCEGVNGYLAINGNSEETIVFEVVGKNNKSLDIFFDYGGVDPGDYGNDPGECIYSLMVDSLYGSEDILRLSRNFRDKYLFESEKRMAFSELYYLISPVVIRKTAGDTQKQIMEEFYELKIKALEKLIMNGEYSNAMEVLKNVLGELTETYADI